MVPFDANNELRANGREEKDAFEISADRTEEGGPQPLGRAQSDWGQPLRACENQIEKIGYGLKFYSYSIYSFIVVILVVKFDSI